MGDPRSDPARFYDLGPNKPDDVPFYVGRVPTLDARVLELGCGTGRVAIPLVEHCSSIHGLDHSRAMLQIGRRKIAEAKLQDRIRFEVGDITSFKLAQQFELIIAPFRVLQNLESDAEVDGLLRCIRAHLAPGGRCILNAFHPDRDPGAMRSGWATEEERLAWQVDTPEGLVACYDVRARVQAEPLVLYPELVYRRFEGGELVEEAVLRIAMRCHYPDELISLVESAGFTVLDKWGGYHGEVYGEGRELVVEFGVEA